MQNLRKNSRQLQIMLPLRSTPHHRKPPPRKQPKTNLPKIYDPEIHKISKNNSTTNTPKSNKINDKTRQELQNILNGPNLTLEVATQVFLQIKDLPELKNEAQTIQNRIKLIQSENQSKSALNSKQQNQNQINDESTCYFRDFIINRS